MSEQTLFPSIKALSSVKGISVETLRAAKALGASGFRSNSSVNWPELEAWLKEHEDELQEASALSIEEIKKQNAIKDGILKDLDIAERKGEVLNPKEVFSFLESIGTAQNTVLDSKLKEISAKVDHATAKLIGNCFSEVKTIFRTELAQWITERKPNS